MNQRSSVVMLLAGTAITGVVIGLRNSYGLYLIPITETLGWSRETFSFAIALQLLLAGMFQPLGGALADRYGASRVITVASLAVSLGVLLMTRATHPVAFVLVAGVLMGIGQGGTGTAVVLGAVGRAATISRRSFYLGTVTAGGSVGQFLMLPLGHLMIASLGWQSALTLTGLLCLAMLPGAHFLGERSTQSDSDLPDPFRAVRGAGTEMRFWLLTAGFFVCGFQVAFIATHLPAYLDDHGIAPSTAAWALSLIGLFNIFGAFTFGVLGGRFSKKYTLCVLYLSRSLLMTGFILLPLSPNLVLLFAGAMGFLWLGTIPLTSGLVGQMFGMRYLGALYGIVFLGHQTGSFLGVWLGGLIYDATGSYTAIWWVAVGLGVTAAVLHWLIDEMRQTNLDLAQQPA